jgi:rare lipoprotein A
LENGKSIVVKVNDRGPFVSDRIIDLSFAAAKKLGVTQIGTALVKVVALNPFHHVAPASNAAATTPAENKRSSTTRVYLQLGAFSVKESATAAVDKLKKITSETIHIIQDKRESKIFYKVQVGPLASTNEVNRLSAVFKRNGLGDVFAVVK